MRATLGWIVIVIAVVVLVLWALDGDDVQPTADDLREGLGNSPAAGESAPNDSGHLFPSAEPPPSNTDPLESANSSAEPGKPDSIALGLQFHAALEADLDATTMDPNSFGHGTWTTARNAWLDATDLRIRNGIGVRGRAFWNFANLCVHELPVSIDAALATAWVDLLSRVCGQSVELDPSLLVSTLRTWSKRADETVYRVYRAHGIDSERLHLWPPGERRAAKKALLAQFGDELDDFVGDVSGCFTDPSAAEDWEAFVDWLVSKDQVQEP